jgi:hypothetical protein
MLIPACLVFFRLLFLPLVALFVCFHALWRGRAELRSLWLVQGVFLLAAIILCVFWQLRIGRFMEFFSIVPLTYLLVSWWDKLRGGLRNRPLFWAEIVVFLLLGPLPVVFLPAVVHRTSLYPDVVLFPAARKAPSCAMESVIPFLNDPDHLGRAPLTIMNTGDTGPQILFSTQHRVIAGNFNISGNADAYSFFSSLKDADAKAAAKKWAADLVLICRTAPTLYLGKDYYAPGHGTLLPGKDGLLHFTNTNPSQPLIQRLIRGQNPPWLKPIEIFGPSDYLLFRIIQQASKR